MSEELRPCHHSACSGKASASLSFRYDSRQVWLLDLPAERDPARYELCEQHADRLTVPRGWERVDERDRPTAESLPSFGVAVVPPPDEAAPCTPLAESRVE